MAGDPLDGPSIFVVGVRLAASAPAFLQRPRAPELKRTSVRKQCGAQSDLCTFCVLKLLFLTLLRDLETRLSDWLSRVPALI